MRDDEEYRHHCEVRYVCRLGSQAYTYFAEVANRRGQGEADKVRDDARTQYSRGNRGSAGEWR